MAVTIRMIAEKAGVSRGTVYRALNNRPGINAEVILGGIISGLASTGLYEMMRNLLDKDGKKDNSESDDE